MSNAVRSSKKRISKDEKICQLKSHLKLSREQNVRLKKEMERLKNAADSSTKHTTSRASSSSSNSNININNKKDEQEMKFREAMRALKKVTVGQEMVINTLKQKAQQRRNEIKQRDTRIAAMEQKMKSLETTEKVLKTSRGDQELHSKIKELQFAYDDAICRKNDLEELLDEKEAQMEAVQKQRNSLLSPLQKMKKKSGYNSDGASVGSGQSGSTAGDFDVAKLKTELAKKSDKILKLEMELELTQDELHEMRQKKSHQADTFGGGGGAKVFFPPQHSFMMGHQQQSNTGADDWTEADETDCESEFGTSFFGKNDDDEDDDFW